MTITRNTISAALVPGLKEIMFDEYTQYPSMYQQFFNVEGSERAYEEWCGFVGVGPSVEKVEGLPITYVDIQQLTPKRVSNVTFALGMRCTMEAQQDDLYGVMGKKARALGKAFPIRREVDHMNIFNLGFGTNYATGQDGLALFSNAHPIKAGVWSQTTTYPSTATPTAVGKTGPLTGVNILATPADLSYLCLTDMMALMARTVDEQGNYIVVNPRYLLVAPEQYRIAEELLKSDKRPGTPDNDINVWKGLVTAVYSPYIMDTDASFLIADKGNHDLRSFTRMPLTLEDSDDFDTGDTKIKGTERYGIGFADWRGVFGNAGG